MIGRAVKWGMLIGVLVVGGIVRGVAGVISNLRSSDGQVEGTADREAAGGREGRSQRSRLKQRLYRIGLYFGAFAVLMGIGGFLVAASGIIPIKASSGHWAMTRWFLNFSMRRSVVTHSLAMRAPSLNEPRLIVRGAAQYEIGCRPCHGSPSLPNPVIPRKMTPQPPYLPKVIPEWEDEELFYIVKHGVKFTGMPAWPSANRDDEVWSMVAFLRKFPELDELEYERLANGESDPPAGADFRGAMLQMETLPRNLLESCARCHGMDGLGRGGAAPSLAGQRPAYLYAALEAYRSGARHSGIMEPIAAGLSSDDMEKLAQHYGALSRVTAPVVQQHSDELQRGKEIAMRGIPSQRVPACVACHGPGPTPRNPVYPLLAGQYAEYLVQQLQLFQKEHRGGSKYAHLMHHVAGNLKTEQMRDVAVYFESLGPIPEQREP